MSDTRVLTVSLETVTPMFLGGADGKTPELRAPSVRGALRYWLRAALGAIVGDNLDALRQVESEVFGSTKGTGAIAIQTWWEKQIVPASITEDALPSSKRTANIRGFPPGSRFQLQLTQRNNSAAWLAAISALLLLVSFGGLGKRCRRGWGTLRIVEVDTTQASLNEGWHQVLTYRPRSVKMWSNYVSFSLQAAQEGIKPLAQELGIKPQPSITPPASYTIASSPLVYLAFKTNEYNTYREAISDFGEVEHNWLKDNPKLVDSVGFAKPKARQASPLWLRVFPVSATNRSENYILLATLFNVLFKEANYQAVSEFLKSADFSALEVRQ
jgi:CRISPR-associated protein Cmr1